VPGFLTIERVYALFLRIPDENSARKVHSDLLYDAQKPTRQNPYLPSITDSYFAMQADDTFIFHATCRFTNGHDLEASFSQGLYNKAVNVLVSQNHAAITVSLETMSDA
jgi:hypothetical protein